LEEMKREDPLPKLRKVMLEHQFTEEELDAIVAEIDAQIDAAVAHALAAPLPDVDEIYRDVLEETA
ncbi:MAG: thiamine pyrophosphate-dependent dehydrogenase E1 component subunit alpha, partial [Erythrobacter cryptus]